MRRTELKHLPYVSYTGAPYFAGIAALRAVGKSCILKLYLTRLKGRRFGPYHVFSWRRSCHQKLLPRSHGVSHPVIRDVRVIIP
jgi:hypothetical protein